MLWKLPPASRKTDDESRDSPAGDFIIISTLNGTTSPWDPWTFFIAVPKILIF